jgi:hydrogenase nickel incorporation protein HypB
MVDRALVGWPLGDLDVLFIENVGNLVCPASYDLGEDLRAVLLSVTEGEDKPLKYPTIFNSADVAVITKMDLAGAVEFDMKLVCENIGAIRPGMPVIEASSRAADGLDAWLGLLRARLPEKRRAAAPAAVQTTVPTAVPATAQAAATA